MVIVGLTGSIGMGKTTAATQLRRLHVPVHDADAAVHELMNLGGAAVAAVAAAFPGVVRGGRVDHAALGGIVYGDASAMGVLESILHPMVRERTLAFLRHYARRRASLVVLDIPLLFETRGDRRVDATIVVTAPDFIQAQRVLARPGMTTERLARIRLRQMPDTEKQRRADFIVQTGLGKSFSLRQLAAAVRLLSRCKGRHWPSPWAGLNGASHA